MSNKVAHSTTSKESACRIICMLYQQTSPKRWFTNVTITSYYDVTNRVYPVTMTTIYHCSILEFGRGHKIKQSPEHHQTSVRHYTCSVGYEYYLSSQIFSLKQFHKAIASIWSKYTMDQLVISSCPTTHHQLTTESASVLPQAYLQKSLDSQQNSLDLKKITRFKIFWVEVRSFAWNGLVRLFTLSSKNIICKFNISC